MFLATWEVQEDFSREKFTDFCLRDGIKDLPAPLSSAGGDLVLPVS